MFFFMKQLQNIFMCLFVQVVHYGQCLIVSSPYVGIYNKENMRRITRSGNEKYTEYYEKGNPMNFAYYFSYRQCKIQVIHNTSIVSW